MTKTATDRQHLLEVMKEFETAMLVSRAADGHLRARPMAIAEAQDDGRLFFCTAIDSPKVQEIAQDGAVNVAMQGKTRYLSLSGHARVERDPALIARLWRESWKVWFPGGKDDPSLCLLEIQPAEAEYWDNSGTRGLRYLFEAARAYIEGDTPSDDREQHAKVRL